MSADDPTIRRRRPLSRALAWICGAVLLIAVAVAAWVGVRGYLAYQHLATARSLASDPSAQLADPGTATTLIDDVSQHAAAARQLTGDPVWDAAEGLPWVGAQLHAVSTVAHALDEVASTALSPLASVAAGFSLDSIRPHDGAIDLTLFADLAGAATAGVDGLAGASDDVTALDTARLVGPLRDAVAEVSTLLNDAHTAADALRRTTALLPPMLGADGPRDYLIVFQNNAEWRSLGGIVGAMVLVHTDNGQITLGAQASSSDFTRYDDPVVPMTDDEIRLFGRQPASFVQNVTQIPDFTRDAPIVQAMWERQTGTTIDGVLSLDPVALSYLLEATGPISLPTGDELNAENAVQLLLNEVYLRYEDPRQQDAFFAGAAASVFAALTSGGVDPTALVTALGRAGEEHRLMIWNAAPEEQSVLDGTTLQGVLGPVDPGASPFGVYLNDGTGSKMDYYMQVAAGVESCTSGEGTLRVTLRNAALADAASLPWYITGGGNFGIPPGEVETVAYIYLPEKADLVSTTLSGQEEAPRLGGGTDARRQVLIWTTQLAPGAEITLDVTVATSDTEALTVRVTPTVHGVETAAVCGKG